MLTEWMSRGHLGCLGIEARRPSHFVPGHGGPEATVPPLPRYGAAPSREGISAWTNGFPASRAVSPRMRQPGGKGFPANLAMAFGSCVSVSAA